MSFWNTPSTETSWPAFTTSSPDLDRYACMQRAERELMLRSINDKRWQQ
jgi:hypothetical protein